MITGKEKILLKSETFDPGVPIGAFPSGGFYVYNPPGCQYYVYNDVRIGLKRVQIPPEKIIRSFYLWDYVLEDLNEEKYTEKINQLYEYGYKAVVQYDFSVFYQEPKEKQLTNILRNFKYLEIAQQIGINTILNFNCITPDFFSLYDEILPEKFATLFCDFNHSEDQYIMSEIKALEYLIPKVGLETAIIRTGKTKVESFNKILNVFSSHGVKYCFVPSDSRWRTIANKLKGRL